MLLEPERIKKKDVSPSAIGDVAVEVTGEMAPPPSGIESLEPHVAFVPPLIPSIPPQTPLEHSGEVVPVSIVQSEVIEENESTQKDKLTLSDSKLWKNMLEEKIELEKVRQN